MKLRGLLLPGLIILIAATAFVTESLEGYRQVIAFCSTALETLPRTLSPLFMLFAGRLAPPRPGGD
jgi:hypothetical protein